MRKWGLRKAWGTCQGHTIHKLLHWDLNSSLSVCEAQDFPHNYNAFPIFKKSLIVSCSLLNKGQSYFMRHSNFHSSFPHVLPSRAISDHSQCVLVHEHTCDCALVCLLPGDVPWSLHLPELILLP